MSQLYYYCYNNDNKSYKTLFSRYYDLDYIERAAVIQGNNSLYSNLRHINLLYQIFAYIPRALVFKMEKKR